VAKSIEDRVKDSFSPDDKESAKYYLDVLTNTLKDYADGIRRSAALMLGFMAVFELVLKGIIKQTTIGPFVLSGSTFIAAFMPTAVAYFFYDALNSGLSYERIQKAYTSVFAIWNSAAVDNDLNMLSKPRTPPYFAAGDPGHPGISAWADLVYKIQDDFGWVVVVGPILFEGYAFYQLFELSHLSSILVWVNAAVSTILLAVSYWQGFKTAD
jgi:hypothetical protein